MKALLFSLVFTLISFTVMAEDLNSRVSAISNSLNTIRQCNQKIWFKDYLQNTQVVLTDQTDKKAWLLSEQTPQIISFSSLPTQLQQGDFGFDVLNGIKTTAVSLDKNKGTPDDYGDAAFALAVHEGFHHYAQDNSWVRGKGSNVRGDIYPSSWEPRFYRSQLLRSLIWAFLNPSEYSKNIGEAAYWQNQYSQKSSDDAAASRYYDITEGTAEYVENMSVAIARLGCNASESAIYSDLIALTKTNLKISEILISANWEYYQIGLFAGLLLNQMHVPYWQEDVVGGSLPVELLLKNVTPLEPNIDQNRIDFVKGIIDSGNAKMGAIVDPFVNNFKSKNYVRLSLPFAWKKGSFQGSRMIIPKDDFPNSMLIAEMTANFISPNGNSEIGIQKQSTVIGDNECGTSEFYFPVLKSEIMSLKDHSYEITTSTLKAKFMAEVTQDAQGYTWYCARE